MKHKLKVVGKRISATIIAVILSATFMMSYGSAIFYYNVYYTGAYRCSDYERSYFTVSADEIGVFVYQVMPNVYTRAVTTTGEINNSTFIAQITNARRCDTSGYFYSYYLGPVTLQGNVTLSSQFITPEKITVKNMNIASYGINEYYEKPWNEHYY